MLLASKCRCINAGPKSFNIPGLAKRGERLGRSKSRFEFFYSVAVLNMTRLNQALEGMSFDWLG